MTTNDDAWTQGCEVVDAVYGPGYSAMMAPYKDHRFNREIVTNQFRNLWADPALTIREKRLMVLGLTTMLGRAELIETQVTGALLNDEFTDDQLRSEAISAFACRLAKAEVEAVVSPSPII